MSHCTTKPTKWHVHPAKTQIRLGIRPVWSESSVGSSAPTISSCRRWIKDWSDWTDAQADPSLRWVHGSFCWFCCAAVHICNIGKGFMHFKNLQILYLYWSNILVFLNWQCKFLSWIFVYLVKTGFTDKRAIWDPVTVTSLSTGFLSQINSHRLVYDSYPLYLQIEILRISLIETKYNQNRVKNPRETSMFLWKSLEMFVMVTGKVSGIRLPRFLIIAFHLLIVCGTILAFYGSYKQGELC